MAFFSPFILSAIFACLLGLGQAQFNQATAIDNGNAVWTRLANSPAVPISSVAPAAQPTLVWNCQQMPSICENAANWLTRQNGSPNLPGGNSKEFVYDSIAGDSDSRRRRMCENVGSPWNSHQCPDSNNVVNSNVYQGLPARVVAGGYYAGLQLTVPSANFWMIPGPARLNAELPFSPSGLAYTCDECISLA